VTAGEEQTEPVVAIVWWWRCLVEQPHSLFLFGGALPFAAETVQCLVPGRRHQPPARIRRRLVVTPPLQGYDDGVLEGILGEVKISGVTDEGGQDPATLDP
jgi:hypothetical protein